uniref:Uncharacterized protein n=1 Tax=Rhizophora mucronata TaxID=61149 RepID=A0A2P2PIX1_RHIMU
MDKHDSISPPSVFCDTHLFSDTGLPKNDFSAKVESTVNAIWKSYADGLK